MSKVTYPDISYDKETRKYWLSKHLNQVNYLLKLKRTKPFWEVVEVIVGMWKTSNPEKWTSYLIHLEAVKNDQKIHNGLWGKRYRGWSSEGGIDRLLTVDFPVWIMMAIKKLYPERWGELQSSKKFYREFAIKFPVFAVFKQF